MVAAAGQCGRRVRHHQRRPAHERVVGAGHGHGRGDRSDQTARPGIGRVVRPRLGVGEPRGGRKPVQTRPGVEVPRIPRPVDQVNPAVGLARLPALLDLVEQREEGRDARPTSNHQKVRVGQGVDGQRVPHGRTDPHDVTALGLLDEGCADEAARDQADVELDPTVLTRGIRRREVAPDPRGVGNRECHGLPGAIGQGGCRGTPARSRSPG